VADERKAGTLESILSLPTTRRVQFAVKLGVSLFLGTVMGGLMPWAEVAIFGLTPTEKSIREGLGFVAAAFAGATIISFYASTLTRNMLQAISLALMVGFTLMTLGTLAMDSGYYLRSHSGLPLMEYIGVLTIPTVLLWLAFKNHKQLQVTWKIWLRNLLAVAGSLAFVPLATALIYQRTWELPLTLEPRHGPAELSGSVRPKILLAGPRMFVLLPDGRLWTTEEYEWEYRYKYYPNSFPLDPVVEDFDVPIPHAGTFSGPASWVNVVSTHSKVAGIQADGSLWKILSGEGTNQTASPRLERIGTDSSWKAIAAGTHFLALKEDGTIWGWGSNESRQLGPGPEEVKGDPVQIGRDSDWAAVFAINSTSIGLKRDGSVWKWGYLGVGPNRAQCQGWESGFYPEPVRWDWEGSDWVSFSGTWSAELILRRDGSLWARGWPSNDNLDLKPVRVGTDFDWGAVALGPNDGLVAVKRGGVIFQEDIDGPSPRDFWRPSRYSDWIAIALYGSEAFVALAADGTLCSWGHPIVPVAGVASLLAPTRRPLWSVNVLDRTQ